MDSEVWSLDVPAANTDSGFDDLNENNIVQEHQGSSQKKYKWEYPGLISLRLNHPIVTILAKIEHAQFVTCSIVEDDK